MGGSAAAAVMRRARMRAVLPVGALLTAGLIAAAGARIPLIDDANLFSVSARHRRGELGWQDLWSPWQGHRIVLPRLLSIVVLRVGRADMRWLMAASLLVAVATAVVLRSLLPAALPARSLLAVACTFSWAQSENWLWGFQVAWFLVNLFTVLALRAAWEARRRTPRRRVLIAAAVLSCLAASLSSGHGMLAWLAVAVLFLLVRDRAGWWFASGFVLCLAVVSSRSTVDGAWYRHLGRVVLVAVQLPAAALKAPVAGVQRGWPGGSLVLTLAGAACWAVFAFAAGAGLRGLRAGPGRTPAVDAAPMLALLVDVGGFVILTAVARYQPALEASVQSRYTTVTGLAVLAAAVLLAERTRGWSVCLGVAAFAVASAAALGSIPGWRSSMRTDERCLAAFTSGPQHVGPVCQRYLVTWDAEAHAEWLALQHTIRDEPNVPGSVVEIP